MSATPPDIRRLAFQALYQLDARGGSAADAPERHDDPALVLQAMLADAESDNDPRYSPAEINQAFLLASDAYAHRARADAFMTEAAPGWPAHRQAAVDRAILRLAHHEMVSGITPPKVAVNEAVELAKAFSTEKSPAFINGLLDKLLKHVLRADTSDDQPAPNAPQPPHPGIP
ncbi:MAG: transcription antitermination factor NusB [Phycisphaerales bacterium]